MWCVSIYSLNNYVSACDVETSAILFNCFINMQIYQEPLCVYVFMDERL